MTLKLGTGEIRYDLGDYQYSQSTDHTAPASTNSQLFLYRNLLSCSINSDLSPASFFQKFSPSDFDQDSRLVHPLTDLSYPT